MITIATVDPCTYLQIKCSLFAILPIDLCSARRHSSAREQGGGKAVGAWLPLQIRDQGAAPPHFDEKKYLAL